MTISRNISNNKHRTLAVYTLIYVANIPANKVGDVSETASNYSHNRTLKQSSSGDARPKRLSLTKISMLLCILPTFGQVLLFHCRSSACKVTKKNPLWAEHEISVHTLRLELKTCKFDLQNSHVACLPACLSLYNLICETAV